MHLTDEQCDAVEDAIEAALLAMSPTTARGTEMRVSDFGELIAVSDPADAKPELWIGPPGTSDSRRLVQAILRGEVTVGGLAEAGWFCIGTVADAPAASPSTGEPNKQVGH